MPLIYTAALGIPLAIIFLVLRGAVLLWRKGRKPVAVGAASLGIALAVIGVFVVDQLYSAWVLLLVVCAVAISPVVKRLFFGRGWGPYSP